jgi:hypothetical protein
MALSDAGFDANEGVASATGRVAVGAAKSLADGQLQSVRQLLVPESVLVTGKTIQGFQAHK